MTHRALVVFLIAIGSLLRFWGFWRASFSGDEANFVSLGVSTTRGFVDLIVSDNKKVALENLFLPILREAHPPMEILISAPVLFLKPREFFVRLVYIILNLIFLVSAYLVLKKLRNRRVSIAYLLIMATSAYAVIWSKIAMYQSLGMIAGAMIVFSIIAHLQSPSKRSLTTMFVSFAVSLLVFADFPLALPAILWTVYSTRRQLTYRDVIASGCIGLFIAGLFYIPWIGYSTIYGSRETGFNIYLGSKFKGEVDVIDNFLTYWGNFFSFPGVITVWPFAILSLTYMRKIWYLKYASLTTILYVVVYLLKPSGAYWYYVSIFGIISLLAAEWIARSGKWFPVILAGVFVVNLIMIVPMLGSATRPFVDTTSQPDGIKVIGETAKRCITRDDETYISTADYGRSTYYFGRPSFLYEDGAENRIKRMKWVLEGDERIKMIHFVEDQISDELKVALRQQAVREVRHGRDVGLLFKVCGLD